MNTTLPVSSAAIHFSWRAVLSGAVVALSIHLLLTLLGGGIVALIARPSASDAPAQSFTVGMAVAWSLSALISLAAGGCVAGKVGAPGDRQGGMMHGFVVWSAATVVFFAMLTLGIGKALTGAANVVGRTVEGAATMAAGAAPDLAKKSAEMIDGYSGEITANGQPMKPAAKREVALGLRNYLTGGEAGRTAQNREALAGLLTRNAGMTPEEAGKTVDEWTASFDRTRQEVSNAVEAAAEKAKEIADKTAAAAGAGAIWTFVAFWIGALCATWGGKCGAMGCRK